MDNSKLFNNGNSTEILYSDGIMLEFLRPKYEPFETSKESLNIGWDRLYVSPSIDNSKLLNNENSTEILYSKWIPLEFLLPKYEPFRTSKEIQYVGWDRLYDALHPLVRNYNHS